MWVCLKIEVLGKLLAPDQFPFKPRKQRWPKRDNPTHFLSSRTLNFLGLNHVSGSCTFSGPSTRWEVSPPIFNCLFPADFVVRVRLAGRLGWPAPAHTAGLLRHDGFGARRARAGNWACSGFPVSGGRDCLPGLGGGGHVLFFFSSGMPQQRWVSPLWFSPL